MTAEGILCGWTEDGEPIYKPWPEVRDCGQCGAPAHWEHESSYEDSPMIICENGHYSSSEGFESVEEQAQYWNDRPLEDALRARIAELEAMLRLWLSEREAANNNFERWPGSYEVGEATLLLLNNCLQEPQP